MLTALSWALWTWNTVLNGFLLSHKAFSGSPYFVNQRNCQPLSLLSEMFCSLSTSWAHTQLSCLIPGTRASQPATQGIPVFSCYVLDCYVIHSHSVCFWKFVFPGDACEIGCLGKCKPLHSSGRIRMHNPGEIHILSRLPAQTCCCVTGSGLIRCRDAEKGRRSLQNHWFLLSLAVTLNEILHFPPF